MFGNRNNTRDRPVCQFYLEGRCRFGDSCKNEHPIGQGGQSNNRFAALDNQRGRAGVLSSNQNAQDRSQHKIEPDLIKNDLTAERPIWPLSSYGPGKNPPRNLISSDLEQSAEEMRWSHYEALAQGNAQQTAQKEASLMQNMDSTIQKILSDLSGAVKFVVDGFDQHPNRIDLAAGATRPHPQSESPFGNPSNTTQINPSTPPQTSSFGRPSSFGQPSALGQTSAFGQPSTVGQASAFGQPNAVGQTSAFGQPSAVGQTSAFGQPSTLGQTSAFGQPTQASGFGRPAQTPAFGQSGFGSNNTQTSTFGTPGAPQSTFGQPSAFGAASQPRNAFSRPSAFGASTQQQTQPPLQSSFGQPSAFGAAASQRSPFSTSAQNTQPAPTTTQPTAFGAPSDFGAAAQSTSPFASVTPARSNPFATNTADRAPAATESPFAQTGNQTQQSATFGQPNQQSLFGQTQKPSASTSEVPAYITVNVNGQLTSFKGRSVTRTSQTPALYVSRNPQTGKDERIWFPTGEPKATADVLAPEECYQGEQGQQLKRMYEYAQQHGVFENGVMPEVPPQRAWVSFDI